MIFRFILILILITTACSSSEEQQPGTTFSVSFEKIDETTGDKDIEESWLIRPRNITVDNYGNVYVADEEQNFIQKFDNDLNFIQSLGREGRGPGEFDNVGDITADSVLLGFDRGTQTIHKFDLEGTFLTSYTVEEASRSTKIIRAAHGFVLAYMPFSQNLDAFLGLHNYSNEFEKIGESQLHASEIYPGFNKDLSYQVLSGYGNIYVVHEQRILIAPSTYAGKIYEYTFDPNSEMWRKGKIIQGSEIEEAYSRLPGRDNADMLFFMAGNSEPSAFRLHGKSFYLTQLSSGQFVHFIYRDKGKERQYGVELFDESLNYLGFEVLLADPDAFDDDRIYMHPPRAKNDQDIFYSVETDEEGTSLVARKLEIEQQ